MLQFKTIENVMMTICACDKHSLIIVYENIGGSKGGRSIYSGFQLQTTLIMIRPSKEQSNLGTRHYRTVSYSREQ